MERENPRAAPGQRDLEEPVGFLGGGPRTPTAVIVEFIDAHRAAHGVEPICEQLQLAASTCYAHHTRPPSAGSVTDAVTTTLIEAVHAENFVEIPRRRRTSPRQGSSLVSF